MVQEEDSDDEKPKRKRAAPAEKKAKAPAKKSKKKVASDDESGEDFGDEIAAVGDDDEEDEEADELEPERPKAAVLVAPVDDVDAAQPSALHLATGKTRATHINDDQKRVKTVVASSSATIGS